MNLQIIIQGDQVETIIYLRISFPPEVIQLKIRRHNYRKINIGLTCTIQIEISITAVRLISIYPIAVPEFQIINKLYTLHERFRGNTICNGYRRECSPS